MNSMEPREIWIWLPESRYPDCQTTYYTPLGDNTGKEGHHTVARFSKTFDFGRAVKAVTIRASADTVFRLYADGIFLFSGPATPGGDFLCNNAPRPQHYATEVTYDAAQIPSLAAGRLPLSAIVRMIPVRICEFSQGHGGFMLDAHVLFADGGECVCGTDETWTAERLGAHISYDRFDARIPADEPVSAGRRSFTKRSLKTSLTQRAVCSLKG